MIENKEQKILKQLDEKIIAQFQYDEDTLGRVRRGLEEGIKEFEKLNLLFLSNYRRVIARFIEKIRKLPIYINNSYLIFKKYLECVEDIDEISNRPKFIKAILYDYPLTMVENTHCFKFKLDRKNDRRKKQRLNIFRFLFNQNLDEDTINDILVVLSPSQIPTLFITISIIIPY